MKARKLHKIIGLILVLPLMAWALTGAVFLLKPGYADAYAQLAPKQYPLQADDVVQPQADWLQYKVVRTVLGLHVLAETQAGWQQVKPVNLQSLPQASAVDRERLLADAISDDVERYGVIQSVTDSGAVTTTGVTITLDWSTLTMRQRGTDTKLINFLYQVHYLQWLGQKQVNTVFAVLGLLCLLVLVYYGVLLYWRGRNLTEEDER